MLACSKVCPLGDPSQRHPGEQVRVENGACGGRDRLPIGGPVLTPGPCDAAGRDPVALPGTAELGESLGRSREAETRGGRVGEQRVYSRTDRLRNVRARPDGESEVWTPLSGERPIEHPVERVRRRPRLPHIQGRILAAATDTVRSYPPQVFTEAKTESPIRGRQGDDANSPPIRPPGAAEVPGRWCIRGTRYSAIVWEWSRRALAGHRRRIRKGTRLDCQ